MNIYYFALLFTLLTVGSCFNKKTNIHKDLHEDSNFLMINLLGTYEGVLPCVDCDGIVTSLELNKNKTFRINYIYSGKSAEKFDKTGSWELSDSILILEGEDYTYKISHNIVTQLDLAGKEIKGPLADQYQLKKLID